MELPRVPFASLSRACDSFAAGHKIGEGATGEVFRGRLDGIEVALKRLHLPEGATPAAKAALVRAFRAELDTLSAYRHTRIVRLLSYAIDEDPASSHPFVLAFELLEEGSLADHLRGPNGEPPKSPQPPLTPLERIDAALGTAAGLAYLHGLPDVEGAAGGGGGAAVAHAGVVLHRDVKAANIGLTRVGGMLLAKVLDCGLARALKGRGPPGAAGASITGGVVGTLGYMAPELARGEYTPRSDIYALGCVLLELLSGARVGPATASRLEEAAVEDGGGVGAVAALAEACWPPPAALALAELTLACIHHLPRRRPEGMAELLARLKAVRALVAPPGPPLVPCAVCMDDMPEEGGLRCRGAERHFICHSDLQDHVRSKLELAALKGNDGNIPCHEGQCRQLWRAEDLQDCLDKGTWLGMVVALRHIGIDGPKEALAVAKAHADAMAAAAHLAVDARVAELRRVIAERDLLLRCPSCAAAFVDYSGCNALTCARCGTGFCAVCLANCGSDAHPHHREAHGEDYFNRPLFEAETRKRYVARLVAAVKAEAPGGAALQLALVAELAKADLRDLGITEAEVLAGAGVGAQEPQEKQAAGIMQAIETRSADAVRAAVLAHPEQLNVREGQFRPLSWAAYFGSEAMVQVLLDAGADATPGDVLSNAYSYSAHGCVTLLRRAGAGGWTPLHAAASLGDAAAFAAAAATSPKTSPAALDDRGFSPRAIAAIFNTSGVLAHALDAAACPPLTPAEAVAVKDQVVIEAAKQGDTAACRGGAYGGGTECGRTALHWAAYERGRCVEALQALLAHAQPALRDAREATGEQWSALHVAAYLNEVKVASVLLAHGASLTVCDRLGKTPLATAVFYQNDSVAALIREAGGK